jgi:hypothetical protein
MRTVCGVLLAAVWLLVPAVAQAQLKLDEVRPTYGRLGTTRTSTRVLPGEDLVVEFAISGVATDADGMANVELSATLSDPEGKVISEARPASSREFLALGGGRFTGFVLFSLPLDCDPGRYLVRGRVTDQMQRKSIQLEQAFEAQPPAFGVVRLRLTNDASGNSPAGGNLTVNQRVYVQSTAVGFARAGKTIHVAARLTILDADGKKTTPDSIAAAAINQEVDDELIELAFKLPIVMNRAGRYSVQLEVRDEISKKAVVHDLPLVVHAAPSLRVERRDASRPTD